MAMQQPRALNVWIIVIPLFISQYRQTARSRHWVRKTGKRKLPAPAEKSQVGSLLYATASNKLLALFTFLVCHGARSFAGRLTRSLAFAATAVSSAVLQGSAVERFNMLQETLLLTIFFTIITYPAPDCKQFSLPFRQHPGAQEPRRSPTGHGGDEAAHPVQQGHVGVAQDADERPRQVVQHAGGQP